MMKAALRMVVVMLVVFALVPAHAEAQNRKKKKKKKNAPESVTLEVMPLYAQGLYAEIVEQVDEGREKGTVNPEALFVAGMSYEALKQKGEAAANYAAIAAGRKEDDPWRYVGESASALAAGDIEVAVATIVRAVELDPGSKFAHYQHGMVLAEQGAYRDAADAFVRALAIDGDFAYAHYYAGMSYYQVRSLVAANNHFVRFVELAPEAPERPQVEGILAAIRG